jgi:hypothetical protein
MLKDDKRDFSYEPFWSEPQVRTLVRVIGWALYSGYSRLSCSPITYGGDMMLEIYGLS